MEKKLDCRFADDCRSVYMSYADSIAMEVYMRGVMDGARLHYAIVSRELPYQPDEMCIRDRLTTLPMPPTLRLSW